MTLQKKREHRRQRYSNELKRKIAKSYLAGEASYAVLAEENGLKDKGVVREFVKWYLRRMEKEKKDSSLADITASTTTTTTDIVDFQELKILQKRIAELELKNEALETLIDLAEETLSIDIRKKSGAKQSQR